ncbi:MAG: 5-bromo-4-chloroindolyl phosphate hydrolysis family protein [Clostridiaceae bacterium]|nr:5-bromo-4-chloroindolyl phosphate hydrolysis family protein [Clostridiaceae bacterium]
MSETPAGMRAVTKKNVFPIYAIGLVWLIWALLLPLYEPLHYLLCAAASAVIYLLLNTIAPVKTEYVKEPEVLTGNEDADELLKTGRTLLAEIAAAGIENEEVRQKLARLDATSRRILDYMVKKPETAGNLRKFFNYYLPTLKKLAETYALMEKQDVQGENLSSSMERISVMLDTMAGAFDKQLDALFGETALDISTDITVMEQLMAQEGLTKGTNELHTNE